MLFWCITLNDFWPQDSYSDWRVIQNKQYLYIKSCGVNLFALRYCSICLPKVRRKAIQEYFMCYRREWNCKSFLFVSWKLKIAKINTAQKQWNKNFTLSTSIWKIKNSTYIIKRFTEEANFSDLKLRERIWSAPVLASMNFRNYFITKRSYCSNFKKRPRQMLGSALVKWRKFCWWVIFRVFSWKACPHTL